jgi:hypothetical protein
MSGTPPLFTLFRFPRFLLLCTTAVTLCLSSKGTLHALTAFRAVIPSHVVLLASRRSEARNRSVTCSTRHHAVHAVHRSTPCKALKMQPLFVGLVCPHVSDATAHKPCLLPISPQFSCSQWRAVSEATSRSSLTWRVQSSSSFYVGARLLAESALPYHNH